MNRVVSGLLIFVGVIHLLPLTGVLGAEQIATLYGIDAQEANIEILMRHRAVLFGLLGSFIVYSAFKAALQPLAIIAGAVSVGSFIVIAWSVKDYNDAIRNVFIADVVALACLVLATAFSINIQKRARQSKQKP